MKQQTAVEWLIEKLNEPQYPEDIPKFINQAKEMERHQMPITDEEIYDGIIKHCKIPHERICAEINAMVEGAKWYREQLKNKDNETNSSRMAN